MKRLLRRLQFRALMDKDADPAPGGGGSPAPGKADDVSAAIAALKEEIANLKAGKIPAQPEPSDVEKVRREAQEKAEREAARARMENAIRFNLSSAKFIEDNKTFLGELAPNLYKNISEKPFSDEEKKESAVKKGLMEYFFGFQENVDAVPDELKGRVMHFKALADDEKEKQAGRYWDCLTLTLNQKKMSAQIEAAKRANSGVRSFEESDDARKRPNGAKTSAIC